MECASVFLLKQKLCKLLDWSPFYKSVFYFLYIFFMINYLLHKTGFIFLSTFSHYLPLFQVASSNLWAQPNNSWPNSSNSNYSLLVRDVIHNFLANTFSTLCHFHAPCDFFKNASVVFGF